MDKINIKLTSSVQVNQWKNSSAVIKWFKNIQNKNNCSFIVFDTETFYPSISLTLLSNAIQFAKEIISPNNKQILNPSKEYFGCNCRARMNVLWTMNILHPILCTRERFLIKLTMDVKDISVLRKHHSKKDSGTILETSSIKSVRRALNFQGIFGI